MNRYTSSTASDDSTMRCSCALTCAEKSESSTSYDGKSGKSTKADGLSTEEENSDDEEETEGKAQVVEEEGACEWSGSG